MPSSDRSLPSPIRRCDQQTFYRARSKTERISKRSWQRRVLLNELTLSRRSFAPSAATLRALLARRLHPVLLGEDPSHGIQRVQGGTVPDPLRSSPTAVGLKVLELGALRTTERLLS